MTKKIVAWLRQDSMATMYMYMYVLPHCPVCNSNYVMTTLQLSVHSLCPTYPPAPFIIHRVTKPCVTEAVHAHSWWHKPPVSKQALIIGRRRVARPNISSSVGVHLQHASLHRNHEPWDVIVLLPRVWRRHPEVHVPLGLAVEILKHQRWTARSHIEWRMSCQTTSNITYQQGMKTRPHINTLSFFGRRGGREFENLYRKYQNGHNNHFYCILQNNIIANREPIHVQIDFPLILDKNGNISISIET